MNLLSLAVSAWVLGQSGPLEVTNVRPTIGPLGPPVAKEVRAAGRLPGDLVWFSFDVKNAKTDASGKATIGISLEITDQDGLPIYKEGPGVGTVVDFLGTGTFPGRMNLEVPLDAKPGLYDLKLTIADMATKKEVAFLAKGKIREPEFGIVRAGLFADREGRQPVPAVSVVGQNLYIQFATVGFLLDKKKGQVETSLQVLDADGKNILAHPQAKTIDASSDSPWAPGGFGLTLNRAGDFTLEIHARDSLAGKTTKLAIPVRVLAH